MKYSPLDWFSASASSGALRRVVEARSEIAKGQREMGASQQDHQKLDRMMESLDQQLGTASAEDKQQMHNALDFFSVQMQSEGPEDRIYCNEGHLHYAQDVNVWGSCPDMQ